MNPLEKFKKFIHETANSVHYDTTTLDTGGKTQADHAILTLETALFCLRKNAYIMGNPGTGKTSSINKIGALMTGIPLAIADAVQIRGSPEITLSDIAGRPDFGELSAGKEKALFPHGHYFLFLEVDEINRIKGGKQSMMLQGIQSGIWVFMNDFLRTEERPIFATANHRDDGNNEVIEPLMDRFSIAFEIPILRTTFERIEMEEADARSRNLLSDRTLEDQILRALVSKDKNTIEKQQEVAKKCAEFQKKLQDKKIKGKKAYILTLDDQQEIADAIKGVSLNNEALFFNEAVYQELGFSHKYGFKRPSDPDVQDGEKDFAYAGKWVKRALGNRAVSDMHLFTQLFAFLDASTQATPNHAKAALKYAINHRLEYTSDCEANLGHKEGTEMMQIRMATRILEEIGGRFNSECKSLVNALYFALKEKDEKGNCIREPIRDINQLPKEVRQKVENSDYPPLAQFRRIYLKSKK